MRRMYEKVNKKLKQEDHELESQRENEADEINNIYVINKIKEKIRTRLKNEGRNESSNKKIPVCEKANESMKIK